MDAATVLLLAQLTGSNAPPQAATDPSGFNIGNVTAGTAITKAWPMLPGTPAAGTVYTLDTEFTGTWKSNALGYGVFIGSTFTQITPSVGAPSFSTEIVAGWLRLTVRVLSATTARVALSGAIGGSSSYTAAAENVAITPVSQTLTVAGGDTLSIGCYFGASTAGQGLATYGSTFTTVSG
jgi:hypothetical protein